MKKSFYIFYPRSNTHSMFVDYLLADLNIENYLILPIRKTHHKDAFKKNNHLTFFERIKYFKEFKEISSNFKSFNLVMVLPFFYRIPSNKSKFLFFEEGLSTYQDFFLENYKFRFSDKLKDLAKLFFVSCLTNNIILKNILLGPIYHRNPNVQNIFNIYTIKPFLINKKYFKHLKIKAFNITPKSPKLFNNKKKILIINPLINNNNIDFNEFTIFIKNFSFDEIKIHPNDLISSHIILHKFKSEISSTIKICTDSIEEKLLQNDPIELIGLNSSLLFYAKTIFGIKTSSLAVEYSIIDKNFKKELLSRYGSINNFSQIFN